MKHREGEYFSAYLHWVEADSLVGVESAQANAWLGTTFKLKK